MRPREFFYIGSVFMLLLVKAHASSGSASGGQTTYSHKIGESGACIGEINAARERAGLSAFAKATLTGPDGELPADATQLWKIPCAPLAPPEEQPPASNELFYKSAYASLLLSSGTPNCTEVVDSWNAAFPNFEAYDLPPPNDLSTRLYSSRDNISFVALYNPSNAASADCRVLTCTETTTAASDTAGDASPGKTETSAHSLICLTTPDILTLNGPPPFTEDQWNKIASSFSHTGSAGRAHFNGLFVALAVILSLVALW